jgi:hypothetical protein
MAHWREHASLSETANNSCDPGTTVYNALMQQAQNELSFTYTLSDLITATFNSKIIEIELTAPDAWTVFVDGIELKTLPTDSAAMLWVTKEMAS